MPTKNWYPSKDVLLAKSGSSLAGGDDEHLPFGVSGSYNFRSAIQFTIDWSGVTQIQSAVLHIKTSTAVHMAYGSDPDCIFQRITSSWTENGARSGLDSPAGGGWSTSGSTYDDIPATSTGEANMDVAPGEAVWDTCDITAIVNQWAPASVKQSSGVAGPGVANYGIRIVPVDYVASDSSEFQSRETTSDPYITLTYISNAVPLAPVWVAPVAGAWTGLVPTFIFDGQDPGDVLASYDIQVASDAGFTTLLWDGVDLTTGISGQRVTVPYAGSALSYGATYYVRARTTDDEAAEGPFSAGLSFKVKSPPQAPTAVDTVNAQPARLAYRNGLTTPRILAKWTHNDSEGVAQDGYRVRLYADSAGSPGTLLYDSGTVSGTATELEIPWDLTNLSYYHVRLTTFTLGLEGAATTVRVRAVWSRGVYKYDLLAVPATWSVSYDVTLDPGGKTSVVVEFGSSSAVGTQPSVWRADLASTTLRRVFWYRVTMLSYGSATPPSPSFDALSLTYSASSKTADFWVGPAGSYVDTTQAAYGIQALRHDNDGSLKKTQQQVLLKAGVTYILSGKVRSVGNSGAGIRLEDLSANVIASSPVQTADATDWVDVFTPTVTFPSDRTVVVTLHSQGAVDTSGIWDAIKLEPGSAPTLWSPGAGGFGAVVVDAGGIVVDGTKGGIFRLRAPNGQNIVLGDSSLELDGSPIVPAPFVGTSAPGGPTAGQLWWDTDDP